ncbi:MAG: hypothetical protein AAB730_00650 [Patescibacteria group bacterium]
MGITIRSSGGAEFLGDIINSVTGLDLGPATSVMIGNPTPFYFEVAILNSTFNIEPSGSIHDSWHVEFDWSQLPVTIRAFTDKDHVNLVGVAQRVLEIRRDQPTVWLVNQIFFLDGGWRGYSSHVSPYPQPDLGMDKEVNIPRIATKSTNVVEIINGTLFDFIVRESRTKGRISDLLGLSVSNADAVVKPGGIYRSTTFDMYRSGRIIRQAIFIDRGRFVGYADPIEFYISPDGPRAQQVLLIPSSIRRY